MELWVVGGALRDLAAGVPLGDLDAACDGDVAALAAATAGRLGAEWRHEPRFVTARVGHGPQRLDLAALRSERYPRPGALPVVRSGVSIEVDLPRRDFTVNAVALGVAGPRRGELLDPLGGLDDLAARRLRALHARSFRDDATRLWRGARYAAAFGLRPEPVTAGWIADAPRWLAPLSGRRLWVELARAAGARRVGANVRLLAEWGALRGVQRGWSLPAEAAHALARRPGPHPPELLLAVLLARLPQREAIATRLAAPREAQRAARDAAALLAAADDAPSTLARLEGTGASGRLAALWLDPDRQRVLQRALRRWERSASPLHARALQRLGIAPGPELGAWLDCLRRARYLGTLRDAASARRHVRAARAEGERWAHRSRALAAPSAASERNPPRSLSAPTVAPGFTWSSTAARRLKDDPTAAQPPSAAAAASASRATPASPRERRPQPRAALGVRPSASPATKKETM